MRRLPLVLGVLLALLGQAGHGLAVELIGPPASNTLERLDVFGVRYRAFGLSNKGNEQVYLGIPNLAAGTNERGKYEWGPSPDAPVSHRVSFTWDPVNDTLITVLVPANPVRRRRRGRSAATTVEFRGVRAAVAKKFGRSVDDVNVLSVVLRSEDPTSSVALNDIAFNGQPLGSAAIPGRNTFTAIALDVSSGFTVTATLVLTGKFQGNRNDPYVDILAGIADCTADAGCDDALACNGAETCDGSTLRCVPGTPVACTGACDTGACIDPDGACAQRPDCPPTTSTSTTTSSTSTIPTTVPSTTTSSTTSTTSTTTSSTAAPSSTTSTTTPTSTTSSTSTPTSTTTSTSTTSTSAPTSTSTTFPPPVSCTGSCGNGVLDAACGEICDGADLGGATCPADRPLGTPTCTATCRRIDYASCMPAPPQEVCGNCFDDDADGLTDFEDPSCCATTFDATVTCSSLAPAGSATRMKLRSVLDVPPDVVAADITDVFVQLRLPDGPELLCARVPAGEFVPVSKGFDFRDPNGAVVTAEGIDRIVVRSRQQQTVTGAFARRADFVTPPPGPLVVTLGVLSRPTSPLAGICATTTAQFIPGDGGTLVYPSQAAANACRPPSKPPASSGHGCD
jgi:hypothetical protein